jgi:hypothetical protein
MTGMGERRRGGSDQGGNGCKCWRIGRTSGQNERNARGPCRAAQETAPVLTPELGRSQRDRFSPSGDYHP